MNEKLRTAVYGFAVGDALGVPYEFKERGTFKCTDMIGGGTWGQPVGTWSDDTSMILATCESIKLQKGKIVPSHIMDGFELWLTNGCYTAHGEVFDVGGTTCRAIDKYHNGIDYRECGERSNISCGNGSLMRCLPLAFANGGVGETIETLGLTHKNEKCMYACGIYMDLIDYISKGIDYISKGNDIRDLLSSGTGYSKSIPKEFKRLIEIWVLPEEQIKSSGYVVDTLEAAVWCFTTSTSYYKAVSKAVNLGGDTDTIAALTGAMAALRWGFDSIPSEWINTLVNKKLIDSCLF